MPDVMDDMTAPDPTDDQIPLDDIRGPDPCLPMTEEEKRKQRADLIDQHAGMLRHYQKTGTVAPPKKPDGMDDMTPEQIIGNVPIAMRVGGQESTWRPGVLLGKRAVEALTDAGYVIGEQCAGCGGHGQIDPGSAACCPLCHGHGVVRIGSN